MSIIRAPRPASKFYVLDKQISEDKRLSWAARGLLVYLLGKPDHWKVSVVALVNETAGSAKQTGRDGVYSLLRELVAVGYLVKTQGRRAAGRFDQSDYIVSESPASLTAQPHAASPALVSTESKQVLRKTNTRAAPKSPRAPAQGNPLPDWLDAEMWKGFIGHREDIGKPLAPVGQVTALAKLDRLRADGSDPDMVLYRAINSDRGILLPVIHHGHAGRL